MSFWADYERESRARLAAKTRKARPRCAACGEPIAGRRRLCPGCVDDRAHGSLRAIRGAALRARRREAGR